MSGRSRPGGASAQTGSLTRASAQPTTGSLGSGASGGASSGYLPTTPSRRVGAGRAKGSGRGRGGEGLSIIVPGSSRDASPAAASLHHSPMLRSPRNLSFGSAAGSVASMGVSPHAPGLGGSFGSMGGSPRSSGGGSGSGSGGSGSGSSLLSPRTLGRRDNIFQQQGALSSPRMTQTSAAAAVVQPLPPALVFTEASPSPPKGERLEEPLTKVRMVVVVVVVVVLVVLVVLVLVLEVLLLLVLLLLVGAAATGAATTAAATAADLATETSAEL